MPLSIQINSQCKQHNQFPNIIRIKNLIEGGPSNIIYDKKKKIKTHYLSLSHLSCTPFYTTGLLLQQEEIINLRGKIWTWKGDLQQRPL